MPYQYDLALSFAGAERELANRLATRLDAAGYSIFLDDFYQAELWGRDLSVALADVYGHDARFCLILLSDEYLQRAWTTHERRHAISSFISERDDYILCLKIDEIELPGFPSAIGYISLNRFPEDEIYKLLLQRLGPPNHEGQLSTLHAEDITLARAII